MAGGMTAIHVYQQNGWWADNRAPFHVQEDLTYGLWVDKIGHFYGASVLALGRDLIVGAPRIGPGATSIVTMAEPIVAAFVAWLALGQSLTAVEIVGIAVALVAIAYVERVRMRRLRGIPAGA